MPLEEIRERMEKMRERKRRLGSIQRELLQDLSREPRDGISNSSIAKALERRGFAIRNPTEGEFGTWSITDDGRAALAEGL